MALYVINMVKSEPWTSKHKENHVTLLLAGVKEGVKGHFYFLSTGLCTVSICLECTLVTR